MIFPPFFLRIFSCALASGITIARAQDTPVVLTGGLTREFHLQAGATVEDSLVLKNPDTQSRRVRLFLNDPASDSEPISGQVARSSAPWITLGDADPVLEPGEIRSVRYRLTVPADPSLLGTYWSSIIMEPVFTEPPASSGTFTVRSIIRYNVQIVAQVGNGGQAHPQLSRQVVSRENTCSVLSFDLGNNGERWMRPQLEVRLFNSQGRLVKTLPPQRARIYPGTTARQSFALPDLPTGDYRALIIVENEDATFGAQYPFHLEP